VSVFILTILILTVFFISIIGIFTPFHVLVVSPFLNLQVAASTGIIISTGITISTTGITTPTAGITVLSPAIAASTYTFTIVSASTTSIHSIFDNGPIDITSIPPFWI
jgi:hypothetical protein